MIRDNTKKKKKKHLDNSKPRRFHENLFFIKLSRIPIYLKRLSYWESVYR